MTYWNREEKERIDIPDEAIAEFNQKLEQGQDKTQQLMLATVIEIRDLEVGAGGVLLTEVSVNESQIESRSLRIEARGDEPGQQ